MIRVDHKTLLNKLPYTMVLLGLAISTVMIFSLLVKGNTSSDSVDVTLPLLRTPTDLYISRLQDRLRVVTEDHEAYLQLGSAYLQKARETGDPSYYSRAENALMTTLDLDPDNFSALTLLGSKSLALHDFEGAMHWANRSLSIMPNVADAYGVLGDAQIELGLYDEGFESYQMMVDIEPGLDSYARVSYARELTGDVEGAVEAMMLAVSAGTPGTEAMAWARVQVGDLYFNSGSISESVEHYEGALGEFNGYRIALAALGKAYAAQGEHDRAIETYERAVSIVPEPATLAALGDLYARVGDSENAKLQYETVEFIAQLQALNEAIYNRELALFYADHDLNLDTALRLSQAEIRSRKDIYGYDALAWALYKNGRLHEAAETIEQAMELGTQDANIFFHAGMIHYGLGNRQIALDHLERALEINPHFSILHTERTASIVAELKEEIGEMKRAAFHVGIL